MLQCIIAGGRTKGGANEKLEIYHRYNNNNNNYYYYYYYYY